jgi:hypothetical protein
MEKYIFLDVDGVINIGDMGSGFDKKCLDNLRTLIDLTKAKVVISSSWREGDLERTKKLFPDWLKPHIVGETIRGYTETAKGSSLPIERGNEIKHWIDRHLAFPWHTDKKRVEEFKLFNEDGTFKKMGEQKLGTEYNYVILDDAEDMLYTQRNNFVLTDSKKGFDDKAFKKAYKILNKYDILAA